MRFQVYGDGASEAGEEGVGVDDRSFELAEVI